MYEKIDWHKLRESFSNAIFMAIVLINAYRLVKIFIIPAEMDWVTWCFSWTWISLFSYFLFDKHKTI